MLRFYRDYGERLLMALAYFKSYHGPIDLRQAEEHANANLHREDPVIADLLEQGGVRPGMDTEFKSLDSLMFPLKEQLIQYNNRTVHDRDLVDTVVRMLQLTFPRNRLLAKSVIDDLRRAILLPSEMTALKARAKQAEMYCSACDHKFTSGEMASVFVQDGSASVRCSQCFIPETIACKSGKHSVQSPKIAKLLEKAAQACDMCEAGVGAAVADGPGLVTGADGRLQTDIEPQVIPVNPTRFAQYLQGGRRAGGQRVVTTAAPVPWHTGLAENDLTMTWATAPAAAPANPHPAPIFTGALGRLDETIANIAEQAEVLRGLDNPFTLTDDFDDDDRDRDEDL